MTDTPTPVRVRAVAIAGNTSINVSWDWQGVPKCANNVRVDYQPERSSLMRYTVGNTTAITSAILPKLLCNTEYTIWVHASDRNNTTRAFMPARGMYPYVTLYLPYCVYACYVHIQFTVSTLYHCTTPAPPTPTNVTAQFTSA